MGTKTLTQVLKETEHGVALAPKYCTSWASGHLGHANMSRGLPKYEVTKRLGCIGMRSAPRLCASVSSATTFDRHKDSFGQLGLRRGATICLGVRVREGGATIHLDTWVLEGA
jgi:hypothetical protein